MRDGILHEVYPESIENPIHIPILELSRVLYKNHATKHRFALKLRNILEKNILENLDRITNLLLPLKLTCSKMEEVRAVEIKIDDIRIGTMEERRDPNYIMTEEKIEYLMKQNHGIDNVYTADMTIGLLDTAYKFTLDKMNNVISVICNLYGKYISINDVIQYPHELNDFFPGWCVDCDRNATPIQSFKTSEPKIKYTIVNRISGIVFIESIYKECPQTRGEKI